MLPALHVRRLQLAAQPSTSFGKGSDGRSSSYPCSSTVLIPPLGRVPPPDTREDMKDDFNQRAQSWRSQVEARRHTERQLLHDYPSELFASRHPELRPTIFEEEKEDGDCNRSIQGAHRSSPPTTHPLHDLKKKRSRRMSNSERGKLYRSRRKDYVETLEQQVNVLKQRVQELEQNQKNEQESESRMILPHPRTRFSSFGSYGRQICEYFIMFEYGIASNHASSLRQVRFLESMIDPNLQFGSQYGFHMLLEQWERYTQYHGALRFQLTNLEILSQEERNVMVCGASTLTVRFTRLTIEKVFPHILWNEALVQKLLGMDITYSVDNCFHFGMNGLIVRYDVEVDFIGAFVKVLGNVREAMQILGQAEITNHHLIGRVEDEKNVNNHDE